jgi:hypothetical protein
VKFGFSLLVLHFEPYDYIFSFAGYLLSKNYLSTAYPSAAYYPRFIGTVAALSSVIKIGYIDNGFL